MYANPSSESVFNNSGEKLHKQLRQSSTSEHYPQYGNYKPKWLSFDVHPSLMNSISDYRATQQQSGGNVKGTIAPVDETSKDLHNSKMTNTRNVDKKSKSNIFLVDGMGGGTTDSAYVSELDWDIPDLRSSRLNIFSLGGNDYKNETNDSFHSQYSALRSVSEEFRKVEGGSYSNPSQKESYNRVMIIGEKVKNTDESTYSMLDDVVDFDYHPIGKTEIPKSEGKTRHDYENGDLSQYLADEADPRVDRYPIIRPPRSRYRSKNANTSNAATSTLRRIFDKKARRNSSSELPQRGTISNTSYDDLKMGMEPHRHTQGNTRLSPLGFGSDGYFASNFRHGIYVPVSNRNTKLTSKRYISNEQSEFIDGYHSDSGLFKGNRPMKKHHSCDNLHRYIQKSSPWKRFILRFKKDHFVYNFDSPLSYRTLPR